MWWEIVVWLVVFFALIGLTVLLYATAPRCPVCKRINVFRRRKSGILPVVYDDLVTRGILIEYICGRCGSHYWFVWTDLDCKWLAMNAPFCYRRLTPNNDMQENQEEEPQ